MRITVRALLAALFVTGSPPFSLFFSEMVILRAGFLGEHVVATTVFLAAIVVLFCGFVFQVGRLVLGVRPAAGVTPAEPERLDFGLGVTLAAAAIAVVSTFYLPSSMVTLIRAAATLVAGGA